ncbi:MAG: winged helix-turn-helix transcriptional regulator [Candidatus Hodarchaeales archaeon]|jgi:DNA-binding Lrp family transcriptional regulator
MENLTLDDYRLLIALQEEPLASYKALAAELEISPPTAKRRLEQLVLAIDPDTPKGEGTIVSADLNLQSLEMQIVDVFLDVDTHQNLVDLERLISEYPYAAYRVRRFGPARGLYIQVRQPYAARGILLELLSFLKDAEMIRGFSLPQLIGAPVRTFPKLAAWQPNSLTWDFDWLFWEEALESSSDDPYGLNSASEGKSYLNRVKTIDIGILTMLTENARQTQAYMLERLPKVMDQHSDVQDVASRTFSRHVQFVRDHLVASYRVHLDWRVFDISQAILFEGVATREFMGRLYNHLATSNFPFTSIFKLTSENSFTWYVRTSPAHFSKAIDFLWKNCTDLQIHFLDYASSFMYYFWPKTWNPETRAWKVFRDFLITEPLERAGIQI